jgi:hypothetical protein
MSYFHSLAASTGTRIDSTGTRIDSAKKLAKRIGAIVVQGAASNFGAHVVEAVQESMHEPSSARSNAALDNLHMVEQRILTSQQGRALLRFLRRALPSAPADRIQQVCTSLVKMDLDLKALALAAKMNTVLLDRALCDDQYMCVNLRVGERLAVVYAAQTITEDELAYKPEPIFKFKRAANVIRTGSVLTRASLNTRQHRTEIEEARVGSASSRSQGMQLGMLPGPSPSNDLVLEDLEPNGAKDTKHIHAARTSSPKDTDPTDGAEEYVGRYIANPCLSCS